MLPDRKSFLFRYGIAILAIVILLLLSFGLRSLGIQLNLTAPIVIAIVAVSWFGGRGPGIVVSIVIVGIAMLSRMAAEPATGAFFFEFVSVLALMIFVVILIAGRKAAQERAESQSELFRTTLASIGDAVITTDAHGNINLVNATAERLLGINSEEAIGKPLGEFYRLRTESSGEDFGDIYQIIRDRREIVTFATDMLVVRRDGSTLPISDSAAPISDPEGNFCGSVIVFQDDTPRREAEQALKQAEHRQQQSQKLEAVGTLTGGVAHDFNNLLTAILGYTQLAMRKMAPDAPAFQNLVNVEKAGNRAAELTRKLLAFSRRQQIETRVIDLNDAIGDILTLIERLIGEHVIVSFKEDPELRPVTADPSQIEQVVMNLCVNARDAMPKGGKLIIETRNVSLDEHYCRQYPNCLPGEYVQVLVSDNGQGMDQETLDRIFEPFFTTKDVDKGTGLGLSMVYGIIKQHRGHINVYSEPGRGTTFKVYLPVTSQAVAADAEAPSRPLAAGGTETILVADDEEALRNLSREVLSALGYSVIVAENGEDAVRLYDEHSTSIDLLLLDVVMPTLGGLEVFQSIRENGEAPPVIFMTGYSSEILDSSKADELGLSHLPVIQKPYTLEQLGKIVRETLDRPPSAP
jgi:two-component system cell cycle sensor histidine kinase/response regulator CckA